MPTNTMTFNQVATLLNAVQQQATGQTAQLPTNTAEFVSVAQTFRRKNVSNSKIQSRRTLKPPSKTYLTYLQK